MYYSMMYTCTIYIYYLYTIPYRKHVKAWYLVVFCVGVIILWTLMASNVDLAHYIETLTIKPNVEDNRRVGITRVP